MKTELDLYKEWCKENTTRNLYEGICLAIENYQKSNSEATDKAFDVRQNEQTQEFESCPTCTYHWCKRNNACFDDEPY